MNKCFTLKTCSLTKHNFFDKTVFNLEHATHKRSHSDHSYNELNL